MNLLCKMLDKNFETRLDAQKTLEHPWIRKYMKLLDKNEKNEAINVLANLKNFRVYFAQYFSLH